ncbi:sorting nexin-16 [Anthonomus grandis grandis]|uniref:sorting nexin-16 n=1 Tax=Anthonomus grandis grandis TaxID=2921223 RepID=UPI00216629CC|nr:sorting nexin-16 [Anthonomus grandis grandis]XP_050300588.1 sorting nexin-16 [Anthonomus grandis grandis]
MDNGNIGDQSNGQMEKVNNSVINSTAAVDNGNMPFEAAEEAISTDSDEYLSGGPLRFRNYDLNSSTASNVTLLAQSMTLSDNNDNLSIADSTQDNISVSQSDILNPIQIPIVGYEIMEERARFTVYKLRIENKINGDCWYVFRRYTDFVRLCNRFRNKFPDVMKHLPRKRWLKNNFDPLFLDERVNGLQTLVNAILRQPDLINTKEIQEFFCLNEPPVNSESNEESRAMFEAFEDTIADLKMQLREKDAIITNLQRRVQSLCNENENLKKLVENSQNIQQNVA